MLRRGFTIIELIIVIAIMGILIVLAIVNLRSTQANSRDAARQSDASTIALNLEDYYTSGNGSSSTTQLDQYPSTSIIGQETTYLPNLDIKALDAPNVTLVPNTSGVSTNPTPDSSLVAATCSSTCTLTTTGVTVASPATFTTSTFVYEPIQANGNLCTADSQGCVKFNLYYMLEDPVVSSSCPSPGNICMITSKNQ